MHDLEIRKIDITFAKELSEMLVSSSNDYNKHFIPFQFDLDSVNSVFNKINKDYFFGIFFDNALIGFYMLRGFDEGYEIPSYGVFIRESYSNKGLGKLTLDHAISLCKILGKRRLMLKVHPENINAKNLYINYGFKEEGIDPKNSNLIMFKDLK
jgi:RimJ/RimL family protein N-acetyltransferase